MNTSEIQPQRTPKAIVNWLYAEFLNRIVDGNVAEAWSQMDRLGVLQQIGVVPPIARGGRAHQTKSPDRA